MIPSNIPKTLLSGFGLIGLMIVVFLLLIFAFGWQAIGPKNETSQNPPVDTYQPIGTTNISGQLEAGFQAKEKVQTTVRSLEERVARDTQGE